MRISSLHIVSYFVLLFILSVDLFASRTITSATLNGASTATVSTSDTVSAAVTVSITSNSNTDRWRSTAWRVGNSGAYTCSDTSNHNGSGTYTNTFNITAPATAGTYPVSFITYSDNGCSSDASSTYTLNSALTVLADPTTYTQTRNFTLRQSLNARGDIRLIGNTILCKSSNGGSTGTCVAPGNNEANNAFYAIYSDIDSDGSTTSSSSADLNLPAGSKILWAGLYWQGQCPTNFTTDKNSIKTIKFKRPGGAYQSVVASQIDYTSPSGTPYQGFADVTSLMNTTAPNGTYHIADLKTKLGTSGYGAWSLSIMYEDSSDTLKNMTEYDGFKAIFASGTSQTVNVSGFRTPLSGTVNSTFFIFGAEGDAAYASEGLQIQNGSGTFTNITNTLNPSNNQFNSNITYKNTYVTTRNPNAQNTAGIDIDTYDISGILGNNQTTTQIKINGNGGDQYYVGTFGFATQIYSPAIGNFDKNVSITYASNQTCGTGKDLRGATLNYEMTFENTGTEAASNVRVYDDFQSNGILNYLDMTQTSIPTAQLLSGTGASTITCDKNATAVYCDFNRINIGTKYKINFSANIKNTLIITDDLNISNTANAHYYNASTGEEITQIASSNMQVAGGVCAAFPVADYRLDECIWNGTSGEVKDSVGTNHGTSKSNVSGNPTVATTVATGQINQGGEFKGYGYNADPNSSYYNAQYFLEIPDNSTLSPQTTTGAISLTGWFQLNTLNDQTILHKGNGSVQEYRVFVESNQLKFSVWNQYGAPSTIAISSSTLSTTEKYFFTATSELNSATNELTMKLYLKTASSSYNEVATISSFALPATSPGSLYIGAVSWGSLSGFFDGMIDEIKVFDSALSETSINKFFTNELAQKNYDGSTRSAVSCTLGAPNAEYRFDECVWNGTTGEAIDSSGNNYHATPKSANGSAIPQVSPQIINNGALFSRTSQQYVELPTLAQGAPNFNDGFTVTAWAKFSGSAGSWERIFDIGNGTDVNNIFLGRQGTTNNLVFGIHDPGTSQYLVANGVISDTNWHFWGATCNGSGGCKLYKDGVKIAESTTMKIPADVARTKNYIGKSNWSADTYLEGGVDELKFFDTTLSDSDITIIYTNESTDKNYDGTTRELPCCCLPTGGNLIANPSFETLCSSAIIQTWTGVEGGTVNMRNNVCGWTMNGSGMETWENTTLKPASNGVVFVEIDGYSTTIDQLSQNLNTLNGTHYVISFDYRARNGGSDRIIAKWNGIDIGTFIGITTGWQTAQIEVIGTGSDILAFEEPSADNDSYGSWIDNIRVAEGTLSTPKNYGFDAWDSFRSLSDRNISTKVVNKPFTLTIAALNETNTAFQDFNGTVCAKIINNADQNISGWNKLFFSDQNSSTTTFTINRAIGGSDSARVKLYWKKNVDTTCPITAEDNATIASDRFSIRPNSFNMGSSNAIAGVDFNLTFSAPNFSGNASTSYNESAGSSFDVSVAEHNPLCAMGTFNPIPNSFSFVNGTKIFTTRYSEVGVLDINITDLTKACSAKYANIDCDDADVAGFYSAASDLPIGFIQTQISIKPHHFDLTGTLSNFAGGNFTYLSDDLNMSAQLDLNITAKNGEGSTTANYSSACYAKNTDLTLIHSSIPDPLTKILYTETFSALNTNILKSDPWVLSLNSTLFNSGSVVPNINLNFDRSPTKPLNPFDFNITSATATDADTVTGTGIPLGNTTFVFGRARAYDVTTNEASAPNPIEFEVYSTASSGFVSGMPQNVLKWYRNLDHDTAAAGNVILGGFNAGATDGAIDTSVTPADGLQIVTVTSIHDQTVHLDISPWLWYSPKYSYNYNSDCTRHPCFKYDYTDTSAGVKGVNSGTFQGSDFQMAPAKNITNKGVKLFR